MNFMRWTDLNKTIVPSYGKKRHWQQLNEVNGEKTFVP